MSRSFGSGGLDGTSAWRLWIDVDVDALEWDFS